MSRIGFDFIELQPAQIIKPMNKLRISRKGLGSCDVFDPVIFPEAVVITEGFKAGFRADSRPGQNDDIFLHR